MKTALPLTHQPPAPFFPNGLYKICGVIEMSNENDKLTKKWCWKMEWCKKERIPPAQKWAWDKAEEAYNKANAT